MRLSIIIPTLNEEAAIAQTLAPLQELRTSGHEIVVADGGSDDRTLALAAPLADRLVGAPRGRARQMNAGAAQATGDVLLFLHADSRLDGAGVPMLLAAAAKSGRRWGRFDVAIDGRSRLLPIVAMLMNARSRATGIATGDQGIFVDRTLFTRLGGFADLPLMEDVELSHRLKRVAGAPLCLPRHLVTSGRRWDQHGAWRTIVTMWRLRYDYWRGADPRALAVRYLPPTASRQPTLQIFAKDPRPGTVKTRLARSIGDDAAARIYVELALRCFAAAHEARRRGAFSRVELWCAPAPLSPICIDWAQRFGFAVHAQQGNDLGSRLRHATTSALARGERVLVIGTDCPLLDADALADAGAALQSNDAVLVPAEDGGYVALGLARPVDAFSGIAWSSADVAAATRRRLVAAGLR
jgi:rSAM/selenodomain-associated transferase 2/rSAM/selenodomain-associated transferase 1